MLIKVCGVTSVAEALACAAAGADAIGVNLWPRSPRSCTFGVAAEISAALGREHPGVLRVGLLVNGSDDERAAAQALFPVLQLHGDEPPELPELVDEPTGARWKGLRLGGVGDLELLARYAPPRWERCVIDAPSQGYGGSGRRLDLALAAAAARRAPVLLAGGLRPDNVAEAIAAVRPWGVDVASGVESAPGKKDLGAVAAFVQAARAAGSRDEGCLR